MDAFDRLKRHLDGPPKVTQQDFADRTGLKQSMVSMLYNRMRPPPVVAIPSLNAELGTTFEDWHRATQALLRARARKRRRAA